MGFDPFTNLVSHQGLKDFGVEPLVDLTPVCGRRNVEAAPHFALREAMNVLSQIMRCTSPAIHGVVGLEGGRGYEGEVHHQGGHQRRDERSGGTETRFVHVGQGAVRRREFWNLRKGGYRGR